MVSLPLYLHRQELSPVSFKITMYAWKGYILNGQT